MAKTVTKGDITQVLIGGRELDPISGGDVTYMIGGKSNESSITGNGVLTTLQTRAVAGFTGLQLSIDSERGDMEYLQDLVNSGETIPSAITHASGATYAGDIVLQGAVEGSTNDGMAEIAGSSVKYEQI